MKLLTRTLFRSHALFKLVLAGVLLWIFSACSGPKIVKVNVQGAPQMNHKQACVIYIYQLSNATNFMETTTDTFWKERTKAFQMDLIGEEKKIKLYPGETRDLELNISDKTKFIGAAADFYEPNKEGWRKVYDLTSKVPKTLTVLIKYDSIEITY